MADFVDVSNHQLGQDGAQEDDCRTLGSHSATGYLASGVDSMKAVRPS